MVFHRLVPLYNLFFTIVLRIHLAAEFQFEWHIKEPIWKCQSTTGACWWPVVGFILINHVNCFCFQSVLGLSRLYIFFCVWFDDWCKMRLDAHCSLIYMCLNELLSHVCSDFYSLHCLLWWLLDCIFIAMSWFYNVFYLMLETLSFTTLLNCCHFCAFTCSQNNREMFFCAWKCPYDIGSWTQLTSHVSFFPVTNVNYGCIIRLRFH
jgi:hypothetical protein